MRGPTARGRPPRTRDPMNQSMGTLDFFLLEAGEYLERLDALAQSPAGTFGAIEELVRLTRALRGSAIMASQHGLARAAQGLESCARAIRDSRLAWNENTRGEVIRAVDDCKILLRRLRNPDQGDTERAEAIGIRLDRLSGRASAAMRAAAGPGLDAGARAFVAREASSVASVLQNAARALRANPSAREALAGVVPAMSALRGVAVINDLPPLGDVLAAVEAATKDTLAAGGSADTPEVFDAAARALARAAREVVDAGKPDPDSAEARGIAARLFATLASGGVVPVESLFHDDAGPHVVQRGTSPASVAPAMARVEMVSQGEYLNAAAAGLGRADGGTQRDLRLYVIAAGLRPMIGAQGAPLAAALGRFAEAARDAIGRGAASAAPGRFVSSIREAADALAAAQSGDEQQLADRLAAAAQAIASLTTERPSGPRAGAVEAAPPAEVAASIPSAAASPPVAAPAPSAPAPTTAPPSPAPAAAAAPSQPPAPAPTPPPAAPPRVSTPAPRATPAAMPATGAADLATSFLTLEQLIAERGLPMGAIAELIAGATAMPVARASAPVPAPAARASAAGPPVVSVESLAPDADVVPVESLLYRGEAALRRAMALKPDLVAAHAGGDGGRLNALIHEVFDLVELGISR